MKTPSGSPLVLVVDDSTGVRSRIRAMLEEIGLRVIEAENGLDAINKLEELKPALVLLDLDMPIMDGISFLKERPDERRDIPVVVVSTLNSTEKIMEALQEGATEYIMKPFDESVLFSKLQMLGWKIN
jgi:two-component system chemotaxis response regulator CheY